ncbi:THUMP domain-containing class I SAM-dependent RNA methyltransferase [Crocinitomix catalasitica]|uniref:THUMP domain-containing class I SAM-dependent RNA methyltransferase n=1 Tax=Crocinitomix catalasitica TaxID=184607 RepID=UPI0006863AE6|nr:class I SAM-dependent RNA methyltransferase [Crocinitomix catalasitica]
MKLVAKTLYGMEDVLIKELTELGAKNIEKGNRVVTYVGDKRLLYASNLWLRTAISVLLPIQNFRFRDEKDLYAQFAKINFSEYMKVNQTFAVKGAVNSKLFNHTGYPRLVLKDAIADHFRDKFDKRPSVDLEKPQILFDIHIEENQCTVSLNSSGAPLFQRGYRQGTGEAPINEVVAAGLIYLSGWDQKSNFIDVTCGSGTIPIEAALMANGIPPNIARKSYSFQYWYDYDQQLWEDIYSKAPNVPKRDLDFKIIGSDTDGDVILKARENIKALPLGKTISFEVKEFNDQVCPEGKGILICNPPYGERLQDEALFDLYRDLGNFFKRKMKGYDCWVISSNFDAFKNIELKPAKKIQVYNGSLSCDFRKYEIFEGSLVEHKYGEQNQRREPKRNKRS